MSTDQIDPTKTLLKSYALADIHLQNYGDIRIRFEINAFEADQAEKGAMTAADVVKNRTSWALSGEDGADGWIDVEREWPQIGAGWSPVRINLAHFAMLTPVEIVKVAD